MLNLYDDEYGYPEYTCCRCDQKDYLLREAAHEVKELMDSVNKMKDVHRNVETALMDNLEKACHMLGLQFRGDN